MSDRETVIAAHPQAWVSQCYWNGSPYKIYADRIIYVALSASHPTEAAAWADAAAQVRQRATRQGQQQGAK